MTERFSYLAMIAEETAKRKEVEIAPVPPALAVNEESPSKAKSETTQVEVTKVEVAKAEVVPTTSMNTANGLVGVPALDVKHDSEFRMYQILSLAWTILELRHFFFAGDNLAVVLSRLRAPAAFNLLMVFSSLRSAAQHGRFDSGTYHYLNVLAVLFSLIRVALACLPVVQDPTLLTGGMMMSTVSGIVPVLAICAFTLSLAVKTNSSFPITERKPWRLPRNPLSGSFVLLSVASLGCAAAGFATFVPSLPLAGFAIQVFNNPFPDLGLTPEAFEHLGALAASFFLEGGIALLLARAANLDCGRLSSSTFSDLCSGLMASSLLRIITLLWAWRTFGFGPYGLVVVGAVATIYLFKHVLANICLSGTRADSTEAPPASSSQA